ncbi:DarT ssDNA thymidine ADP-ribosyltransferase family protein [Rhizobium sp. Nf11,1]|uniref:DarT ssDNA thymidine ADP-ribosyltransferase family protein n=1 Tax=Rhizobium sp. Nf11,1 TaxID=3404923 RepID=UPI003D3492DB
MTVEEIVAARSITEVVHFTTNHGCLGTLYTEHLQSRKRLQNDKMVKYLFAPNANLRKDPTYVDYVSLSVSHINTDFFQVSSQSWHRDEPIFWCVLSFSPDILSHEGVVFSSTNNIYPSVIRGVGAPGLEVLFANKVAGRYGSITNRSTRLPASYPTDFQAEALYPRKISTDFLQRIYVANTADQSEIIGFLKATFHRDVDVVVSPEKFGARPI